MSSVPAPAIDPIVSSPLVSNVAPDETVTAWVSFNEPDKTTLPSVIARVPECVFVPDKIKSPSPAFVKVPEPVIIPCIVWSCLMMQC